jgi:hypothetical protein
MLKLLPALLAIWIAHQGNAQQWPEADAERVKIVKQGLWSLGAWSGANVVMSGIGLATSGGEAQAFHQMNLGWAAVNLGIAIPALVMTHRETPSASPSQAYARWRKAEVSYAFNTALDLTYLSAGIMFRNGMFKTLSVEQGRGFGHAMLLQGGFLLVYDAITWIRLSRLGKRRLLPLLNNATFTTGLTSFRVTFTI